MNKSSGKIREKYGRTMEIRDGKFGFDFRLYNPHSLTMGETYIDTSQVFINLTQHESFNAILDTLYHETLHACLKREEFNDDIEHAIIRNLLWYQAELVH